MKIIKFVDHYLKPHAKCLPSHVQDTTDFINKLKTVKDKPIDSILVTLDVPALYTHITNHESVEAAKETLDTQTSKSIAKRVIIKFLYVI